jgi:hypothetical protein
MNYREIQVGEIIPEGYEIRDGFGKWRKDLGGYPMTGYMREAHWVPMRVRVEEPAAPPAPTGYWRELRIGDVIPAVYQQRDEFGEWVNHTGTCMVGLKVPEHEPSCALRRVWVEGEAPKITDITYSTEGLMDSDPAKNRFTQRRLAETPKMVQCGCKKHSFPEGSDPYAAHAKFMKKEHVEISPLASRVWGETKGIGVSAVKAEVGYDLQDVDGGGV